MKKNKKQKYTVVLLFLAAGIWGVIIYRLLDITGNQGTVKQLPTVISGEAIPPGDTLYLNYRDPFLGRTRLPATSVKKEIPPQIKEMPPRYRFMGSIRKAGKEYILLDVNGETHMLSLREKVGEYTLQKIYRDSIVLVKGKQHFTLHMDN